jgi:hypothetical protein
VKKQNGWTAGVASFAVKDITAVDADRLEAGGHDNSPWDWRAGGSSPPPGAQAARFFSLE